MGSQKSELPSARLTLHSTKLCIKFKLFRKKIFLGTKVTSKAFVGKKYFLLLKLRTSETFLRTSQDLKVTRLQGYT